MTLGVRIRDENTGALRMEVTDYTVAGAYVETMYIAAPNIDGYRVIAGISEATHIAFMVPCFDLGVFGAIAWYSQARMPRVYISGSIVYWSASATPDYWYNGYYTLQVVRIQ